MLVCTVWGHTSVSRSSRKAARSGSDTRNGQGYYLVGEPDDPPTAFFELTPETMLALFPARADSDAKVGDLLETLTSHTPDVEKLEKIVDSTPVTERGLDVLGTIASIRARELAIAKLGELSNDPDTPEAAFQHLFAAEPWMLGAQYSESCGEGAHAMVRRARRSLARECSGLC